MYQRDFLIVLTSTCGVDGCAIQSDFNIRSAFNEYLFITNLHVLKCYWQLNCVTDLMDIPDFKFYTYFISHLNFVWFFIYKSQFYLKFKKPPPHFPILIMKYYYWATHLDKSNSSLQENSQFTLTKKNYW